MAKNELQIFTDAKDLVCLLNVIHAYSGSVSVQGIYSSKVLSLSIVLYQNCMLVLNCSEGKSQSYMPLWSGPSIAQICQISRF